MRKGWGMLKRPGRSWATVLLGVGLCVTVVASPSVFAASAYAADVPPPAISEAGPANGNTKVVDATIDSEGGASALPTINSNDGGSAAAPPVDEVSPAALLQEGFQGPSYQGATYSPSSDKPESKLWWNDGFWWADMFDQVSGQWHIFRLERSTETWVDTGTPIDLRANTLADVLWDGTHLYVASHVATISTDSVTVPSSSGSPALLYRYSYSTTGHTYSLDSGFPATITTWSSKSMTLDEDSTGVLWATWTQVSGSGHSATAAVYVNSTSPGDQSTWGTPFVLPVGSAANPSPDDISALVSYKNDYVGVLWSNQLTGAFYWAVHHDGDAAGTWQQSVALSGSNIADDHMNVKTLQSDSAGRVYAAIKTSADLTGPSTAVLIDLLVFTPGTGDWARIPVRHGGRLSHAADRRPGQPASGGPHVRDGAGSRRHLPLHRHTGHDLREDRADGRPGIPLRSGHPGHPGSRRHGTSTTRRRPSSR